MRSKQTQKDLLELAKKIHMCNHCYRQVQKMFAPLEFGGWPE